MVARPIAFFILLLAAVVQNLPGAARAETLTIATHEAPPFVMRDVDGQWSGLAIALWEDVASAQNLDYRYVESDLDGMIAGVADGRYDAGVGALTITAARETRVDFTPPYYTTGFGIAVRREGAVWTSLLVNLVSWAFLKAVLALAGLLLFVGFFFWLAERRANRDQFGGEGLRGLGSGLWFAAVTMTTVGYGDKAPVTLAGWIVALVWMFVAIVIISAFTGALASALTAGRLQGAIAGPDDLPKVSVGSISGSASDAWLARDGIGFASFPTVKAGLAALADGRIDAFVYDKPILQYSLRRSGGQGLHLLPGTFGRQDYGIALPLGSDLRQPINVDLLRIIASDAWGQRLKALLGRDD
jgi:ABC-type amino acid transport substrate-binding protein